jgi:hypothetical protein
MPSVHLHHLHLLLMAHGAAKRSVEDAKRPNALTDDALIAIVVAATAAEAFINELAYYLRLLGETRADWAPVESELLACADVVNEVEDRRGPVTEKYHAASRALPGGAFDKGALAFQDFACLVRLRNAIVHLKPEATDGQKWTDVLAARGLALPLSSTCHLPWLDRLLTPQTGAWAARTARNIMLQLLEKAPRQYDTKGLDPLISWEEPLRNHAGFAAN